MEEILNETDISRILRSRGIETMDDPRSLWEIGRQFGLIPVEKSAEIIPVQESETEV